ncbi:hypothetical protein BJF90_31105 [Pseudonocardia sp. CNS-004]|nr:hypothetical protein BJF90_31105 [Pseudonocardia sp. CNS-004]
MPTVPPSQVAPPRPSDKPANGGPTTGNSSRTASGARPDGARPEQRRDGKDASGEQERPGSAPAGNGSERSDRSPSASRTG